ncbi:DUF5906 domain-containing protein [Alloalcanivorax xenomutans]|uniref:DUF5906 domain-containing protein n=1 Tax=Alloalcanivorax xenomutans TaxID=1094342 RepID=UPI001F356FB0|nr:DUF5906 domain-containing protein [Alloalcanivorax xenomutans]MCE7521947.1 PriCT-2 domain-containing protein [Alloalcanivorax xenomutans]
MRPEPLDESEVRDALQYIRPDSDRPQWMSVAAALKDEFGEDGKDLFIAWSEGAVDYDKGATDSTWRSVAPGHYTLGTVIKLAQDGGWQRRRRELTAEERRQLNREHEARRRARQAEIEADAARSVRMQETVAEACEMILDEHTHHLGRSEYLGAKGVGAHGIRFFKRSVLLVIDDREDRERCEIRTGEAVREFFQQLPKPRPEWLSFLRMTYGSIAMPLRDVDGELWCLQVINGQAKKLFPKYARKKGNFHLLGSIGEGPVGFAEGYATAAMVHELTGWPVVTCVDSGNMKTVADHVLARFPGAEPVWLSDNDAPNPQTGVRAGQAATAACLERHGGVVLMPDHTIETEWCGDWNDLAHALGREVTRQALLSQYQLEMAKREATAEPPNSPAPSEQPAALEAPDLDRALARFAWTVPDGKIWDAEMSALISQQVARTWLGKDVFKAWLDHPERRSVAQADVVPLAERAAEAEKMAAKEAAREARIEAAQQGGGGVLGEALNRYVLLYPSQSVWDRHRREIVALNDLKPKLAGWYTNWLEHPLRQELDRDRLVFDPAGQHADDEGYLNMFRGLPLAPRSDPEKCRRIRELILHLCNQERYIAHWLMCWLAYPLQAVGSKMASAVLMHSEIHGTGKSLLFEEVIKPLYGEYGATLGQHQLESQYTDWRSQKLFGLFEEVFSRDQKYSHTGTLKHMITGNTHRIEKKFVSGWEEANHMNAVFLSNEIQPFPVEPSDRRMLVIWPRTKLGEDLKQGVLEEIANGGVEAFYGYLLALPLEIQEQRDDGQVYVKFGHHSEPPMTVAKQRLIDFGRPSWDTFHHKWHHGELDVPYQTCLSDDLYAVYNRWCSRRREHAISQTKFSTMLASREEKVPRVRYKSMGNSGKKGTFFWVETGCPRKDGESQEEWLGRCVDVFRAAMRREMDDDQ